jgi:hypothetical protein
MHIRGAGSRTLLLSRSETRPGVGGSWLIPPVGQVRTRRRESQRYGLVRIILVFEVDEVLRCQATCARPGVAAIRVTGGLNVLASMHDRGETYRVEFMVVD